jgi:N-acetylglucosamine-6-phosphate deacetylase
MPVKRVARDAAGRAVEVEWTDSTITRVALLEDAARARERVCIAPGLVDIQVNGYAGVDVNAPDVRAEDLLRMAVSIWGTGVTTFLPTVCTGSSARMERSIRVVREAFRQDRRFAASVGGIHVEGPYISPDEGPRGAHPREHVRRPDWEEFSRWQDAADGTIRIVTLSPEWDGAARFIERASSSGVVPAIGHTQATTGQLADAVAAGARLSTHLGNGAHAVLPRHPNYIWDQLADDRLWASLIADGHHLPPATLKCFLRAKTPERVILTSDAVALAGLPPGRYGSFGGRPVDVTPEGRVQLAGTPYLAGAGLPLIRGVENVVRHAGATLEQALRLATSNPSDFLSLHRRADLAPGAQADLVRLRWDPTDAHISVLETIVAGETVHGTAAP